MTVAIAVYAFPPPVTLAVATAAFGLMLPAVARHRGRWWYEAAGAWLVMRGRCHAGARLAARSHRPQRTEVAALAPGGLAIRTVNHRDVAFGVAEDGAGWFAAIALRPPDGAPGSGELRLDWLTPLVGALSTVQVVVRQSPLELAAVHSPSAQSYEELRAALAVAPEREAWVAVRLRLRDAAAVDPDGEDEIAGVHRLLGSALSRISEAMRAHGLSHRVLDGAGLEQALVDAYVADPYDKRAPAARERWSRWRTARAVHVCFGVTGWPDRTAPDLLTELARVPGATAVCTSVVMGPMRDRDRDEGPLALRVLVRVVAAPTMASACARQVRATARRLRLTVVRLDGEHAPAVYATMPTASADGWGGAW
jgi:type VII secretion protein EccE